MKTMYAGQPEQFECHLVPPNVILEESVKCYLPSPKIGNTMCAHSSPLYRYAYHNSQFFRIEFYSFM